MGVREGGSYVADLNSGEPKLVERTEQKDPNRVEAPKAAPEVPSMPAAPLAVPEQAASDDQPASGRRRSPETKPQE